MDPVLLERLDLDGRGCAALLTLNRPDALNALSEEMLASLHAHVTVLDADPDIRVLLLTGAGRAFCAGGDLKSYRDLQTDPVAFPQVMELAHDLFRALRHASKPVVCLVNGVSAAGGLELMLSSDLSYAARSARIGDGHLRWGQMGGGGSLALLPRAIGPARARELVFSARLLDAQAALDWGLVNRVVEDGALVEAGLELAREIAAVSPLAVANAKYALNLGLEQGTGVDAALMLEKERTAYYCLTSEDAREGLAAFSEKREPRFSGR
jgi:enoyl-CoA hydratase